MRHSVIHAMYMTNVETEKERVTRQTGNRENRESRLLFSPRKRCTKREVGEEGFLVISSPLERERRPRRSSRFKVTVNICLSLSPSRASVSPPQLNHSNDREGFSRHAFLSLYSGCVRAREPDARRIVAARAKSFERPTEIVILLPSSRVHSSYTPARRCEIFQYLFASSLFFFFYEYYS